MVFTKGMAVLLLAVSSMPAASISATTYWAIIARDPTTRTAVEQNGISALQNGVLSFGSGVDVFEKTSAVHYVDLVSCGFDCANGLANPQGALLGQNGSSVGLAVHIVGAGGATFKLSDFGYTVTATPNSILLGTSLSSGQLAYGFSANSGIVGKKSDGTLVTSGVNTTVVSELFMVLTGVFVSTDCSQSGACVGFPAQQTAIDNAIASISATTSLNAVVKEFNPAGGGQVIAQWNDSIAVTETPAPEPSTCLLLMVGLLVTIQAAGRRKRE